MEDEPSFMNFRPPSNPPWHKKLVIAPKNLYSSTLSLLQGDVFKVYLRIKPNIHGNKTHIVQDENTIVTHVPTESVSSKILTAGDKKKKFMFTSILEEHASQREVFQNCVLPSVKLLLRGEDMLVLTYGTTSAGKTFTMHGTSGEPGIIPRVLSQLFRSLENKLENRDSLRPHRNAHLIAISEGERRETNKLKNTILALDLERYQKSTDTSYVAFRTFSGEEFESIQFREMEQNVDIYEEVTTEKFAETFTVWISMFEIYNENIVDLLVFPNEKDERPSLALGEDDQGGFYVKNAKLLSVRNGHEAYQITQFGRSNLHRAPTALNDKSSRSHCLLTITLVGHNSDGSHSIHRITLADLAGSERAKKTLNNGKRLIESNSINKSLSTLGNCLKILKENQTSRLQKMVPIRDSKLTKLFKNALSGSEKLTFIVNISTDPVLFDETLTVLKFSALAQDIVSEPTSHSSRQPSRFSQLFHSNYLGVSRTELKMSAAASMPDLSDKPKCSDDDYNILKKELHQLQLRETHLERELEKYQNEIQLVTQELFEKSESAEQLRQLYIDAQKQRDAMGSNMSDHLFKVINEKNQKRDADMKEMRAKHSIEVQELNKTIRDLRKLVKEYECDDTSLDRDKYNNLMEKLALYRDKNKNLEELLEEAKEDFAELTLNNIALKEEKDRLVEGIEQLSTEMAHAKMLLEEEQLLSEELTQNNIQLQEELDSRNKQLEDLRIMYELTKTELTAKEDISSLHFDIQLLNNNVKNLSDEILSKDVLINKERMKVKELQSKIDELEATGAIPQDVQSSLDYQTFQIDELRIKLDDLEISHESQNELRKRIRTLEQENDKLAAQWADSEALRKDLELERSRVNELECEVVSLRAAIKVACTKEMHLINEREALKAAVGALEQEALSYSSATVQLKELDRLREEVKIISDKLNAAEYQSRVYLALKEEAEEERKIIPELRANIERLENELINKENDLQAFENRRDYLITQHEREIQKNQEAIEALKRDVDFRQTVWVENNKKQAESTEEIKRLREELDAKNMELKMLKSNGRSPLRNKTNMMVPTARLIEFSPFCKVSKSSRLSKSEDDILFAVLNTPSKHNACDLIDAHKLGSPTIDIHVDQDKENILVPSLPLQPKAVNKPLISKIANTSDSLDDLPLVLLKGTKCNLNNSNENTLRMSHDPTTDTSNKNIDKPPSSPLRVKSTRKAKKTKANGKNVENTEIVQSSGSEGKEVESRLRGVSDETSPNKENAESGSTSETTSPVRTSKSTRKPRTARKNQLDHPALATSTRSRRRSPSQTEAPPPPRSAKKQLFSSDDFLEFDDSEFLVPESNPRRTLRVRSRKH